MNPKDGKAVTCVKPTAPGKAVDADDADPGEIAKTKAREREQQKGKYGSTPVKPFKPAADDAGAESASEAKEPPKDGWVEVELVDEAGKPVAGARYEVTLPDGSVASGTLDAKGLVRIEGFEPGDCKVTFPDLDTEAWEKA
jgi:type VI secretion system secreted protein VgrG